MKQNQYKSTSVCENLIFGGREKKKEQIDFKFVASCVKYISNNTRQVKPEKKYVT